MLISSYPGLSRQSDTLQDTKPADSTAILSAASAATSQSLTLKVVTAEGDRVTLGTGYSLKTAYARYQAINSQTSTRVRAEAAAVSETSGLSLVVEGNLSRDEVKDLAKAIQAYSKVMKDVLSGRFAPVTAHAAQIGHLDEIARFDARFATEQVFSAQTKSLSASAE
jgi:hypothetical protein